MSRTLASGRNVVAAITAIAIGSGALTPGDALATRYASPTGTGTTCGFFTPCKLDTAVNGAAGADEIVVAPGTYLVGPGDLAPLSAAGALNVHGTVGQPRPVIVTTGSSQGTLSVGPDSIVSDLDFRTSGAGVSGDTVLYVASAGTVERVTMGLTFSGSVALSSDGGATVVRDSAIYASSGTSSNSVVDLEGGTLLDDTIDAQSSNSIAVSASGATIENTILLAPESTSLELDGAATIKYSNYRQARTSPINPGNGNNQSADPALVDETGGDLHETAASPTIQQGFTDPNLGPTDPDGTSRIAGGVPDVGAFQFVPAPPSPPTPPAPTPPVTPPPPAAPLCTAAVPATQADLTKRKLDVTVSCNKVGTASIRGHVTVSASSKLAGVAAKHKQAKAKRYSVGLTRIAIPAGRPTAVKATLPAKTTRAIEAALKRHVKVSASLTVTVTDSSGNHSVAIASVARLRAPKKTKHTH